MWEPEMQEFMHAITENWKVARGCLSGLDSVGSSDELGDDEMLPAATLPLASVELGDDDEH